MIRVSVFYPNEDGARFDMDYYRTRHIPLVREKWGPLGLVRAEIDRGLGGGAGEAPMYLAAAHLYFENVETFQKAATQAGQEVFADVPNYTSLQPRILVSEIVEG